MIVIGSDKWKVKNRMRRPRFPPPLFQAKSFWTRVTGLEGLSQSSWRHIFQDIPDDCLGPARLDYRRIYWDLIKAAY